MSDDNRKFTRIPFKMNTEIVVNEESFSTDDITNLSVGGCLLPLNNEVDSGTKCQIKITLEGTTDEMAIRIEGGKLVARYGGASQMYFSVPVHELIPAEGDLFIVDRPARDVIRFDRVGDHVTGLTMNPGPWAMKAEKVE